MMTGWPRYFPVASASARIVVSVDPPGGQGQISVTGLAGNCCAAAPAASASATAPAIRRRNMSSSFATRRRRSGRRELCPYLGKDPRRFAALHARDVVLVLEQRAERVVDRLGIEGERIERH